MLSVTLGLFGPLRFGNFAYISKMVDDRANDNWSLRGKYLVNNWNILLQMLSTVIPTGVILCIYDFRQKVGPQD